LEFVGRHDALSVIHKKLEDLDSGRGACVFFRGETGSGKTRLISEIKRLLISMGRQSVEVRARQGLQAYGLTRLLIRKLASLAEIRSEAESATEKAGDLIDMLDSPEELRHPAADELLKRISYVLGDLVSRQETVVLLEDLQLCDVRSLEVLKLIAPEQACLIVGTFRSDDPFPSEGLVDLVAGHEVHNLDRLTEDQLGELVSGTFGIDDDKLVRFLYESSEGIPLMCELVLKELLSEDVIQYSSGNWLINKKALGRARPPGTIVDLFSKSIDGLGEREKEVLCLGSVFQGQFSLDLLSNLDQARSEQVFENVPALVSMGFLIPVEDGAFSFAHRGLREAAYKKIPADEKQSLHANAAALLEDAEGSPASKSYHYLHSGDLDRALENSILAADQSSRNYANEEAIHFYGMAVDILKERDDPESLRKLRDLLVKQGEVLTLTGTYDRALSNFTEAYETACTLGDETLKSDSMRMLGNAYWWTKDYEKAIECYKSSQELDKRLRRDESRERTLHNLALAHYRLGDYSSALKYETESLEIKRALGNKEGSAKSLDSMGLYHQALGELSKALELHEEALSFYSEVDDRTGQLGSENNIASVMTALGRFNEAIPRFEHALELSRDVGDRESEAICLGNLAEALKGISNFDKARSFLDQALSIADEIGDAAIKADILRRRVGVEMINGNLGGAIESARKSRDLAIAIGEIEIAADSEIGEAMVLIELELFQQAEQVAQAALEKAKQIGFAELEASALCALAKAKRGLNHADAESTARSAIELSRRIEETVLEAACCAVLAGALTGRDQAEAVSMFRSAFEIAAGAGSSELRARTSLELAHSLGEASRVEEALEYVGHALSLGEEINSPVLDGMVQETLGDLFAAAGRKTEADESYHRCVEIIESLLVNLPEDLRAGLNARIERIRDRSARL
jgi:tetratricopeptide (TPR) repeat protein